MLKVESDIDFPNGNVNENVNGNGNQVPYATPLPCQLSTQLKLASD